MKTTERSRVRSPPSKKILKNDLYKLQLLGWDLTWVEGWELKRPVVEQLTLNLQFKGSNPATAEIEVENSIIKQVALNK
jgi:hypothetical protein